MLASGLKHASLQLVVACSAVFVTSCILCLHRLYFRRGFSVSSQVVLLHTCCRIHEQRLLGFDHRYCMISQCFWSMSHDCTTLIEWVGEDPFCHICGMMRSRSSARDCEGRHDGVFHSCFKSESVLGPRKQVTPSSYTCPHQAAMLLTADLR